MLSSPEDWLEVKRLRACCDAILVGAETIRRDNPSLVTRNEELRAERERRGLCPDPVKVTLSRHGKIDPKARFFTEGCSEKIVIAGSEMKAAELKKLSKVATVILTGGRSVSAGEIIRILEQRGIHSLFVEGGSRVLTLFFLENAVDFLRLSVAPFFVGDPHAPRFVEGGKFYYNKNHRMHLIRTTTAGDMTVTEYALKYNTVDCALLREAIALAEKAPKSPDAYSVGAVIITADGRKFTGYSRETAPHNHAEEEAILKADAAGVSLEGATIYSSMEPCSTRKSKPVSCTDLIIRHKMKRVVLAAYEPANFVTCFGVSKLSEAGIVVTVIEELSGEAMKANAHITSGQSIQRLPSYSDK